MITRNIIILLSLVQFSMNGLAQKQAEKLILNETIQYLSIDQNGYGGNIVVNVVDEKKCTYNRLPIHSEVW